MTLTAYLVLTGCMLGISAGQLLFKLAATSPVDGDGPAWRMLLSPALLLGLTIYGLATIAWLWQLRSAPLSRAVPFMALGFIITPLAASWLFGEPTGPRYWLGAALIAVGVAISATEPV